MNLYRFIVFVLYLKVRQADALAQFLWITITKKVHNENAEF